MNRRTFLKAAGCGLAALVLEPLARADEQDVFHMAREVAEYTKENQTGTGAIWGGIHGDGRSFFLEPEIDGMRYVVRVEEYANGFNILKIRFSDDFWDIRLEDRGIDGFCDDGVVYGNATVNDFPLEMRDVFSGWQIRLGEHMPKESCQNQYEQSLRTIFNHYGFGN